MSQKENQELTNQAVEIEDLTVKQNRATEVKVGGVNLCLGGILQGDAQESSR
jgi:hypothetical protein